MSNKKERPEALNLIYLSVFLHTRHTLGVSGVTSVFIQSTA
nr:MAG TPA: hypothetical protein [Caudoviricetes sp.]